jgi:MoxR-like ATPase
MAGTLIYNGPPSSKPEKPASFKSHLALSLDKPENYLPDPGLKRAANAALRLGHPLLLTGEPGVGKSQFAKALAYALGMPLLEIFAQSGMTKRDLFYNFDHLRRLYDTQSKSVKPAVDYLTFNALGMAILIAAGPGKMTRRLPNAEGREMQIADLAPGWDWGSEPARTVVLVDEIDKAPRDMLNDMLNEMERMLFDIPEIGQRVGADPSFKPVLVMTSNSEKSLPDPFLRRCVYYNIPFPPLTREAADDAGDSELPPTLGDIVARRIQELDGSGPLVTEALQLFGLLRQPGRGFERSPGTAELLNWLLLVVHDAGKNSAQSLKQDREAVLHYLPTIAKSMNDAQRAESLAREWLDDKV